MRPLAVVLVVLSCGPISAQQRQSHGVRDLAVRLAANAVPAGIVASDSDFTAMGRPPGKDPRGLEAFRADLPQILSDFERRNPAFRAQALPGTVFVASKDQPQIVTELLSRSVFLTGPRETSAADAILRLAARLRNSRVTGIVGSGIMPGPSCPLRANVRVSGVSYTVMAFLNDVVQQAPGLVWVVTYDMAKTDGGIRLGLVCPDGSSAHIPLAPGS